MVVACYRAINIRHRHRVHQVRFPTARSDKREDSGLGHGGVWPDFHSCGLQQREIPCGPTGELRTTEEGTSLSKVWFTISSRCHMKRHQDECFSVKNQQFCYSDYLVQPGFRQSASHGGPIREGLPVRIRYYEGQILRLDVRADSLPSRVERASYAKTEEAKWNNWVRNDPTNDRLGLALNFAFILISLCWNFDWRHYMRYWFRRGPPYSRFWELVFRAFFLLTFIGSSVGLIRMIAEKHRTAIDFEKAALYSLFWIGFFGIFDIALRIRLRIKKPSDGQPQPTVGS
jgi:hypothetical protein